MQLHFRNENGIDLSKEEAEALDFGMEVELEIVPFRTEPDGTEVMTYAFRPA